MGQRTIAKSRGYLSAKVSNSTVHLWKWLYSLFHPLRWLAHELPGSAWNYREPALNHPRTSSPLIWSYGAHDEGGGAVILQSTWDAGLKWTALGCVAKTTKQNFLKYKRASRSRACFCPVVHSDLWRAPFSGPQVSSNKWIYKARHQCLLQDWDMRTCQCQGGH